MTSAQFLHFDWTNRAWALGQHRAFLKVVTDKISHAFKDIETEADRAAEEEFERLSSQPYDEGVSFDMGEVVEVAMEKGFYTYSDLQFVQGQLHSLSVAGMYHLWERTLKKLVARERWISNETVEIVRRSTFSGLIDFLTEFGFNVRSRDFFDGLETINLVANVCKHGEGKSFARLTKKAPELFLGPFKDKPSFVDLTSDDLWIEISKMEEFGSLIDQFWTEMPEHLQKSSQP